MSDQIGAASIALSVDSSGVDTGVNQVEATVRRAGRTIESLGRSGSAALDGIGAGATAASANLDRATQRQIRSVQTLTAELQSGGRATREFQETMARNRGGEAAVAALRPYLDELERVREAQNAAAQAALRNGSAFQSNSQSAAQLAANLRAVPAQLTDIVTSLQGGQQPLTVLLQQGGQLRDMFGSVGGAARGLGGYIVSLVSPLTVAGAAVAALGVAYYQGSKEADAFRKAIVLTGNVTGVTTGQLAAAAKQAAGVSGTISDNAEAIAALVSTGRVGAEQLASFSAIAVQSQKLLGISIEDTAKAYADLGKDPLQASLKLNEQYHFLTLATYQQIKALQDQGKSQDAAKAAQQAYAAAQDANNQRIAQSLGTAEKAWNSVKSAAKGAWDAMLNVGREETVEQRIAQLQAKLAKASAPTPKAPGKDVGSVLFNQQVERFSGQSEARGNLAATQDELALQEGMQRVEREHARITAADAKSAEARAKFDQDGIQFLSTRLKYQREIAAAEVVARNAAGRDEPEDVTQERVNQRLKEIRQSYADYFNQTNEAQIAAIKRLGDVQEEQARRAFIPTQTKQDAGYNKELDDQFAFIDAKAAADEKALQNQKANLQKQLALVAQETVGIDGQYEHQQKLADLRAAIGLKDEQILTRRAQREAEIYLADTKNNQELAKQYQDLLDSRQADLDGLQQQIRAQEDENETIGLSAQALQDLKTRRIEEKAARLESQAALIAGIPERQQEYQQLLDTAKAMRELNTAQLQGQNKSRLFQQYDDLFNSIDQAAKAAFTDMGNGFESVFKKAEDSLRAGLMAALYELTAKQFLIDIKARMTGADASPEQLAQQQLYDATGYKAGNNAIGNVANALSLYKLTSSAGSALTAAGNLFGSSAVAAFGQGLAGGAAVTDAAAAYAAVGEHTIASALTAGSTVGSIVSTALPYVAAAVVAYKAWGALFEDGPESDTRLTFGSNNTAGNISINERGNEGKSDSYIGGASTTSSFGTFGVTSTFWAPAESDVVKNFVTTVGKADDALAKYLTTTEQANVSTYLTGKTDTAHVGAEGQITSENASAALAQVFNERIMNILEGVEPGLSKLEAGFQGTSAELATEAEALLAYRAALRDSGEAVFGVKVTLQDIAALKQPTEATSAALKRVSDEFSATNALASALGRSSGDAFGALGLSSEGVRKNLITLVGSLDELTSQTSFFAQNFLTDAERLAPVTEALNKAFASLGISVIPETRDQFKQLVQSYDPATEAGQKMIASLLDLEEAFAETHPAADATTTALNKQTEQRKLDIQLMDALGQSEQSLAAQRADAIDALLSDQAKITQAQIYAAEDAKKAYDSLVSVADDALSKLSASISAEKERLNDAYNEQAAAIRDATQAQVENAQKSLAAAQTQASAIQSIFSTLDSALSSTKIESDSAASARRQAAQSVLAGALANPQGLADNKALEEAISTITGQSNTRLFGTFEEYARDQARTNNALVQLRDEAGTQADYAELTVERLNDTIDAIQKSGDQQLEALQENNEAQLDALDKQLANDTAKLNALKGINDSVLSLKDAFESFAIALAKAQGATDPTNSGATQTDPIESLYESLLGRAGDSAGLQFWHAALSSGQSVEDIAKAFISSDEYKKKLNSFDVGTNFVTHDQTANIHYGERIIPAADNAQLMALMARAADPAQNNSVLADEVARLRVVVAQQGRLLEVIAANTGLSADTLEAATKGGRPIAIVMEK